MVKKCKYEIKPLMKEQWAGTIVPIGYTTNKYYDIKTQKMENGFQMLMELRDCITPITHTPEEHDYPDRLYADHYEQASAWGVLVDEKKEQGMEEPTLIACIETCPEDWSNRLRVTELWVHKDYRRQGIGHGLMEMAKKQMAVENRRALILETQSCNVSAISFYLSEGFQLIGFDSCCYSNHDLDRREVRIELGILSE